MPMKIFYEQFETKVTFYSTTLVEFHSELNSNVTLVGFRKHLKTRPGKYFCSKILTI